MHEKCYGQCCTMCVSLYLRLIKSCALAGGPSPIEFVPIHEYHPSSDRETEAFIKVINVHPPQLSP